MTRPPLFSLITVTKDNPDGLRATQKSVQQQTQQNFEWIVIDGGKDQKPDRTDIYINEPDNGIYDAMNKGIERSKGDYILFLNAGDTLAESGTLAKIAAGISTASNTPDFIFGDALEGTPDHFHYKKSRTHNMAALGMFTHHQAMLYRRDVLGSLRYSLNYKIAGDYEFTMRFLAKAQHILYLYYPLCLFEPGGVSQKNAARGRKEQFDIRHSLGISNMVENAAIYLVHMISWNFRRLFPALYWRLRKSH